VASTNLNGAAASQLQWTETIKDAGFTHSNVTNSHQITLDNAGDYFVHVEVPFTTAVTNVAVKTFVQLNGATVVGGTAAQGYVANAGGNTEATDHWSGASSMSTQGTCSRSPRFRRPPRAPSP